MMIPPESRGRIPAILLSVSAPLFAVALGEFAATLLLASPAAGANIGAGLAILSMLAAAAAGALGAALRKGRMAPPVKRVGIAGAVLALLFASQGVVLVGLGIAEEL